jgi:hypothetical protein
MEIATALGRKLTVIPVLVGKANMPGANDLPDEISPLARRQAYELTDGRWADDCRALAKVLKPIIACRRRKDAAKELGKLAVGLALVVVVTVIGLTLFHAWDKFFPRSAPTPLREQVRGSLSGDWSDSQYRDVRWRISHYHDDIFYIAVDTWNGQRWRPPWKGRGQLRGVDGATLLFSLSGNRTGELTLSWDQDWLSGYIRDTDGKLENLVLSRAPP